MPTYQRVWYGGFPASRSRLVAFKMSYLRVRSPPILQLVNLRVVVVINEFFCCLSNGGSAGLESLVVDSVLVRLIDQIPLHLNIVKVRSDGYWSLCEPYYWQLPPEIDQWQPIMGPYTQMFTHALKVGPVLMKPQQQPIMANGLESVSRRSFGTMSSPSTTQSEQSQNQARVPGKASFDLNYFDIFSRMCLITQLFSLKENPPPQLVSYATQVDNMPSPKKEISIADAKAGEVDSDLSAENKRVLSMTQAPVSSMPDLRTGVERTHPPPKSLPSTPTFPKTSPPDSKPSSSCSNSGQLVRKRSRGESFGEEISPSSPKMSKTAVLSAQIQDEILWGFDGLKDLSGLADPEVKAFIFSLTEWRIIYAFSKSNKQMNESFVLNCLSYLLPFVKKQGERSRRNGNSILLIICVCVCVWD